MMVFTMVLGWRSHVYWKKHNVAAWGSHTHKWSGRLYLVLILIDGVLPNASPRLYYGIPALVIFLIYVFVAVRYEIKRRTGSSPGNRQEERTGTELSSRSRK
jgi:hypothetical protein